VSSIDDQDMIQAFFSDGTDPMLSKGIGVGSAIGGVDNVKALGKENVIEHG